MEWIPLFVFLNGQDGRAFRIGRVIFQDFGIQNPGHDLPNSNTIGRKFLITVFRDPDIPFPEKFKDSVPCFTHEATLTSYSIFIKITCLSRGDETYRDPLKSLLDNIPGRVVVFSKAIS